MTSDAGIEDIAVGEARRLGHGTYAPEHLLLGVVRGAGTLGRALAAAGLTADVLERLLAGMASSPSGWEGWATSSPAWHELERYARGWAAAHGREPEPSDGVIAFVWTGRWPFPGVSRDAVVEAIRVSGVELPSLPLQPLSEDRYGDRVWFPSKHLRLVLEGLPRLLPDPHVMGWNVEGDRAWVIAGEGVELTSLVERLIADQE